MDRVEPARQVVEQDVAFPSGDGIPLSARYWPRPTPAGAVVIAHGFGEHGGCYGTLAETLATTLELDVLAFDFRGHGRSAGKRGVLRRYDDQLTDLAAALDWVRRRNQGLPTFLLGHSNGGLVALRYVLERDRSLGGLILSNPALKLLAVVPAWKKLMGAILLRVAPSITLDSSIPDEDLTADPLALVAIAADPLRHSRISPPLYFGMLDAGRSAMARAGEIDVPTLLLLGGADPLIDPEAGRRFFEGLGSADKALRVYPEMKHEPLQEQGREVVVGDIVRWLGERLRPGRSGVLGAQG